MQTKLSKSLTLDNGTDFGDLPFHAVHAITVERPLDGCIVGARKAAGDLGGSLAVLESELERALGVRV